MVCIGDRVSDHGNRMVCRWWELGYWSKYSEY